MFPCKFESDILDNTHLLSNARWGFGTICWADSLEDSWQNDSKNSQAWTCKFSFLRLCPKPWKRSVESDEDQLWFVFLNPWDGWFLHIHADIWETDSYFWTIIPLPHVCQWEIWGAFLYVCEGLSTCILFYKSLWIQPIFLLYMLLLCIYNRKKKFQQRLVLISQIPPFITILSFWGSLNPSLGILLNEIQYFKI